jgi:hypothetical protein
MLVWASVAIPPLNKAGERVDLSRLDPVFLAESRTPMKEKYGVEFFPTFVIEGSSGLPFPKFFQVNRDGDRKGILVVSFA